MSKIELSEMLKRHLVSDLVKEIEKDVAVLEENDPEAKLKKVIIQNVSDDTVLVKIDAYDVKNISGLTHNVFRNPNEGDQKRCDYLLITKHNGQRFLLFVEMKSNTIKSTEISQKFQASDCLFEYILSILKSFHGYEMNEYAKRYILFQRKNLPKRTTRQNGNMGKGLKPNGYLIVNDPTPTLKSLIRR